MFFVLKLNIVYYIICFLRHIKIYLISFNLLCNLTLRRGNFNYCLISLKNILWIILYVIHSEHRVTFSMCILGIYLIGIYIIAVYRYFVLSDSSKILRSLLGSRVRAWRLMHQISYVNCMFYSCKITKSFFFSPYWIKGNIFFFFSKICKNMTCPIIAYLF